MTVEAFPKNPPLTDHHIEVSEVMAFIERHSSGRKMTLDEIKLLNAVDWRITELMAVAICNSEA